MDQPLRASDAGRVVLISSGAASNPRAYRGPYAMSKAALEALGRSYAAETASTPVRVNIWTPPPTRTRMRAIVMPGEDPMTLPTPEEVVETIIPLCLPSFTETGKIYDYRAGRLQEFRAPA
jgi:NAD(P)-dependent dehydrogenase (short-subunit alcohol dehydrogenase family)